MLKFTVKEGHVLRERVDAILVGIYEDAGEKGPLAAEVNRLLGGAIDKVLSRKSFTGKVEQTDVREARRTLPASYFILCGLGKAEKAGLEQIRQAMGRAVLRAREMGLKRIGVSTNSFVCGTENIVAGDASTAMTEGANLALYTFNNYRVVATDRYKSQVGRLEGPGEQRAVDVVRKGIEK